MIIVMHVFDHQYFVKSFFPETLKNNDEENKNDTEGGEAEGKKKKKKNKNKKQEAQGP